MSRTLYPCCDHDSDVYCCHWDYVSWPVHALLYYMDIHIRGYTFKSFSLWKEPHIIAQGSFTKFMQNKCNGDFAVRDGILQRHSKGNTLTSFVSI